LTGGTKFVAVSKTVDIPTGAVPLSEILPFIKFAL
jgi:hypothetical protein